MSHLVAHDVAFSHHWWSSLWLWSKVVFSRFIHWRVTVFPFYNYMYLGNEELIFETIKFTSVTATFTTIFSIHRYFYLNCGVFVVARWWFSNPVISSLFIILVFYYKSFLFISMYVDSWISILFSAIWFAILIICFDIQIVPDFRFSLTSVSMCHNPTILFFF